MAKKLLFLAAAAILVVVVGIFGFSATFSNLGPGETLAFRMATLLAACLVGGIGVGLLLNAWWPAAVACSWGPVAWGGFLLLASVREGSWTGGWYFILVNVLVVPAMCLLGGFAGFRLRQHFFGRASKIRS